jgi:hypothetical protein
VPIGHYVKLEFTEFQLEEHGKDCDYDRVTVQEGTSKIVHFCGTPKTDGPKEPIESKGRTLLVKFRSDHSETAPGFWAHFTAQDTNECLEQNGNCSQFCHNYVGGYYCSCSSDYQLQTDGKFCKGDEFIHILLCWLCKGSMYCSVVCNGIIKTDCHGVISSPEYPNIYPDHAQCDWTIVLPPGYQVEVTFLDMAIEFHDEVKCPYDYLKVNTGRSPQTELYCGKSIPSPVTSQANVLKLYFSSDHEVGLHGFKLQYKAKPLDCGDPGTPANGQKIDSNYTFPNSLRYVCDRGFRLGSNYTFPNSLRYVCDRGFRLVGSSRRDCQTNGLWSGTSASCIRVSCGDPGVPAHGKRTIIAGIERNYVYEDKVQLSCNELYKVSEGNAIRTCLHNGMWSGDQLICKPICGARTFYNRGKIIGGAKAVQGSYPWMAMLYKHPCTHNCLFCGGSILDNNFVITAAHCIHDIGGRPFIVRIGAHNVNYIVQPEWWCTVKNITLHPNYDSSSFDYDAALLEIDECNSTHSVADEIVMSRYIRPICLPSPSSSVDQSMYNVDEKGIGAGWGIRKVSSGSFAKVLQHVQLPISNTQVCQTYFSPQNWIVTPRMFCATATGQDTCHGDSGGPFMVELNPLNNPRFILLGIISWGDSRCGVGYGVYTKVITIVPWIQDIIGN